ncbi:hypothetical protein B0J11DRAFT_540285 [Dendryphion nanum]|uniref:Peptidase metallopeptidase domain-containing protein n=1 Tax=Dendryphion nanum TaxID=256645 RepID=A0A9P9D9L1_9PLEO|nr:hypothetical protein B0J11DRAFT_540285 [Dendryphion nanum]
MFITFFHQKLLLVTSNPLFAMLPLGTKQVDTVILAYPILPVQRLLSCLNCRGFYPPKGHHVASLRVGYENLITIWKQYTIIKIYVSTKFGTDYDHVASAALQATKEWNSTIEDCDDARPRFEIANTRMEAMCEIKPGKDYSQLAQAFFPGWAPYLYIHPPSLQQMGHRNNLQKTLLHEFGHVLGARHQFQEPGYPSVLIGVDDDRSVMNYFRLPDAPRIQQTDIEAFKKLYALEGDKYKGLDIIRIEPVLLEDWEKRCHQLASTNHNAPDNKSSGLNSSYEFNNATDQIIMLTVLVLILILFYRTVKQ